MKFLCIQCDEAMKLLRTDGPDDGSLTVVFGCPACKREMAMLTNAMETQMVRSLGVKVGGRQVPATPMETVRSSLAHQRPDAVQDDQMSVSSNAPDAAESTGDSKCPFTGMVEDAISRQGSEFGWTSEAEARLARIPEYVRPMVRKSIEQYAREQGLQQVDVTLLDQMKGRFGLEPLA